MLCINIMQKDGRRWESREKERQMGRGEKTTDFKTSENREEINRLGSVRVFLLCYLLGQRCVLAAPSETLIN